MGNHPCFVSLRLRGNGRKSGGRVPSRCDNDLQSTADKGILWLNTGNRFSFGGGRCGHGYHNGD